MENFELYEHRVCYYETDKMGIVHHSNYIRWFEDARVDFLEKVGLPYDKMESMGVMIVVLGAECRYVSPARFGDRVVIIPRINFFNGVKLSVDYRVIRKEDRALLATGGTSHCFTGPDLKPVRTKKAYPDIYKVFNDYVGADLDG